MKLLSTTNLIIEETLKSDGDTNHLCCLFFNYAKFFTRPLEKWMFVPCDEKGNVLKGKPLSPAPDSEWIRWENEQEHYFKALSKVLFAGFQCIGESEEYSEIELTGKDFWITIFGKEVEATNNNGYVTELRNIEDLQRYSAEEGVEIQVTDNFLKLIYETD